MRELLIDEGQLYRGHDTSDREVVSKVVFINRPLIGLVADKGDGSITFYLINDFIAAITKGKIRLVVEQHTDDTQ